MLDFVRKEQYFQWVEAFEKLRGQHASASINNLKDIQDHYVISKLSTFDGAKILEIGGADCRVLRDFSNRNECWNAEKFEGKDGGPSRQIKTPGVNNVSAYLGDFDIALPTEYFDVVFSISVVEHVVDDKLHGFFNDIARVLKPGGLTFHAIDLYVFDRDDWSNPHALYSRKRMQRYLAVPELTDGQLQWVDQPGAGEDPSFSCAYATNADREMLRWNRVVPSLAPIRAISQSVSLIAELVRQ